MLMSNIAYDESVPESGHMVTRRNPQAGSTLTDICVKFGGIG